MELFAKITLLTISAKNSILNLLLGSECAFVNIFRFLSSKPHIAGSTQNNGLANWIEKKFKEYQLDNVVSKKYNVLLSYPVGSGKFLLYENLKMFLPGENY